MEDTERINGYHTQQQELSLDRTQQQQYKVIINQVSHQTDANRYR